MLLYCTANKRSQPQLLSHASIGKSDGGKECQKPDNIQGGVRNTTVPPKRYNTKTLLERQQKRQGASVKSVPTSNTAALHTPSPMADTTIKRSPTDFDSRQVGLANNNTDGIKMQHRKKNRHVRFHSVELREYAITLGDNPSCTGYFPITLDWHHAHPVEISIGDFEADKNRRRHTTSKLEFHMDTQERWERLLLISGMNQSTLAFLEQERLCRP